jgi:hypothetical protein
MHRAAVKASARLSTAKLMASTRPPGMKAAKVRRTAQARKTPRAPPSPESRALSASSWDTSRRRPAPIATRTAISFWRDAARARSRFVTLAQAISSTSPTAAHSTTSAGWMPPRICSTIGCR